MDAYFRQTWVDERLRFTGVAEMAVHFKMLQKIWKPDTYFLNGKDSYLHTITEPNKLLRINPNGTILYSMRFETIFLISAASINSHLLPWSMNTVLQDIEGQQLQPTVRNNLCGSWSIIRENNFLQFCLQFVCNEYISSVFTWHIVAKDAISVMKQFLQYAMAIATYTRSNTASNAC